MAWRDEHSSALSAYTQGITMKFKIPFAPLLLGPSLSLGLGFTMNALVMAANGGQMPVLFPGGCEAAKEYLDFVHSCMTPATRLKFLADWIVMHSGVASPGDFFLWLSDRTLWPGLILWAALMIYKSNEQR